MFKSDELSLTSILYTINIRRLLSDSVPIVVVGGKREKTTDLFILLYVRLLTCCLVVQVCH